MSKILIYTTNHVGEKMAGPAIRAWELAKALSKKHEVTLVTSSESEAEPEFFSIIEKNNPLFKEKLKDADLFITQNLTLSLALQIKKYGVKVLIDAYDPLPLEVLELFKHDPLSIRNEWQASSINQLIFNFQMADAIICASEKQRDLWIGFLLGHQLITPKKYDQETSLRHFIDVVPFGLSSTHPQKTGPGLKDALKLKESDKILLWGGGIWNWFDPLVLIRAMGIISKERNDIKLVFMGIKTPDPTVPEMAMSQKAITLASDLGLIGESVFFNHEWVPYEERQNHLLDATIGVSTHFDHLETRFSFRTRLLDYLWADLPIISTEGDSFAEIIEKEHLGKIIPYEDEKIAAKTILNLIDDHKEIAQIKENCRKIRAQYYWESVVLPIEKLLNDSSTMSTGLNWQIIKNMTHYFIRQVREKGLIRCFEIALKKITR